MKKAILIVSLFTTSISAFGKDKYTPVVIDQKKINSQKSPEIKTDSAKEYAAAVKALLKKDLKTVDVHLADEGSLKWLFVVVNYNEWKSFEPENRRELVELLLRHMKKNYPNNGLKVSVGVDADQPLAEGDWTLLADGPNVKLIGE